MTATIHPLIGVRTARPTSPSIALRSVVGAGFSAVVHEGVHRAARVVPGGARLGVVVAEEGHAAPMAHDVPVATPTSSTTVWAHADGTVFVRASWAPPALLIRGERVSMLPEIPGTTGQARLDPGDRLVVLSSSAYESAPGEIVRLLHDDAPGLAGADAGSLLGSLLGAVPGGAGVVLTRLAPVTPVTPVTVVTTHSPDGAA